MCRADLEPGRMLRAAAFGRRARHVFGVALFACLSGCGTMQNLDGRRSPFPVFLNFPGEVKPRVYGGVRNDIEVIIPDQAADWREYANAWPVLALLAADIPVSAVADTVTIPIVLHRRRTRTYAPVMRRATATENSPADDHVQSNDGKALPPDRALSAEPPD